jgi:hypothetical protein
VKGSIMAIIGVLISRVNIGIEQFLTNLIFAPIAYLFIAISGLTVIKILQVTQESTNNSKINLKQVLVLFGSIYVVGIVLTVVNVVLYSLNTFVIVFIVIIEALWVSLGFLAYKNKINNEFACVSIVSLVFTLGIIYGALLNMLIIPLSIYFILLTASFLQAAREFVKSYDKKNRGGGFITISNGEQREKNLKISLILQVLSCIFLILPIFSNIAYPALYLLVMIIGLIIVGFAAVFTIKSIIEKKDYLRTSWLLKYGILVELIAFLVIGS